jgi:Mce-associated membrane protein
VSESTSAEEPAKTPDESTASTPAESTEASNGASTEASPDAPGVAAPESPVVPDSATSGRFPLSVSRPVALIALAVAVVLLVGVVTLGVVLGRRLAVDRASTEALATARSYAVVVTSYDYRTLDQDFTNVLNGATGEFKDQYGAASKTLRNLVTTAQASAKGTVLNAGVESATTDRVVVLLFMNQAITNASTSDSRMDRSRLLMTLTKNDGQWLASKVELR